MGKELLHLGILYFIVLFPTSIISEQNPGSEIECSQKYNITDRRPRIFNKENTTLNERCFQRCVMLAYDVIDEHGNINMTVVKELYGTVPPWVDADLQQQLQEGHDECYRNRMDFSNDNIDCIASNDFATCIALRGYEYQEEEMKRRVKHQSVK